MKSDRHHLPYQIGFLLLLVGSVCAPRPADAQSFCDGCQVQVGLGGTYHYWGETGSLVLPVPNLERQPL
ncbi:MAG: hypothetical protein E6J20_18955 [Chloroflexi bacterium]|nr:MAG: hypothetical protein E6J20_18955 [Chloroflexota bacterium]